MLLYIYTYIKTKPPSLMYSEGLTNYEKERRRYI